MNKIWVSFLPGIILLSACGNSEIIARDSWIRAAPEDGNSAAYLILQNNTGADDELVGASSDSAQAVELHESKIGDDGVMQMIPRSTILIRAGEEVEFEPGGLHVMFVGLKQNLDAGDEITMTLHFKNGKDISINVPVKDTAEKGGAGMDGYMP